ncbi:hypothetical protein CCMSSC00406_0009551 [Pleurotus cornucopiae]|uniref:Uncharacterized protein n=1 Tax=Pleurotus cornucopiae TaxID=5321 RepID=A0ACB7IRA1_PLECO|nr:hypothetical protein CCMSSC00406_0009551 [Pleurotus cornucopiae]
MSDTAPPLHLRPVVVDTAFGFLRRRRLRSTRNERRRSAEVHEGNKQRTSKGTNGEDGEAKGWTGMVRRWHTKGGCKRDKANKHDSEHSLTLPQPHQHRQNPSNLSYRRRLCAANHRDHQNDDDQNVLEHPVIANGPVVSATYLRTRSARPALRRVPTNARRERIAVAVALADHVPVSRSTLPTPTTNHTTCAIPTANRNYSNRNRTLATPQFTVLQR